MATFRYFAECQGAAVQLQNVFHDGHVSSHASHFFGRCPTCGEQHQVARKIERPSMPSQHECDGRCMSARGFRCECSCGGKNHGRGAMLCEAVAA